MLRVEPRSGSLTRPEVVRVVLVGKVEPARAGVRAYDLEAVLCEVLERAGLSRAWTSHVWAGRRREGAE